MRRHQGLYILFVIAGAFFASKGIVYYLLFINLLSGSLFALDKWFAIRQRWRIPERILLATTFLGGAPLALVTMILIRHKVSKRWFSFAVVLALLMHGAIGLWFLLHPPYP